MQYTEKHIIGKPGSGLKILETNLNSKSLSFTYPDIDINIGQFYVWDLKARSAYEIQKVALQSDTGTITATVKKNGVAITGLTAINATTVITDYTATALNTIAIGDLVEIYITNLIDSPTTLHVNLLLKII